MDKTIKEIADKLGVSKSAIRKLLTDDFRAKYTHKNANRILINSDGQTLIEQQFSKNTHTNSAHESHTEREQNTRTDLVPISILEKQLAAKDEQISELHKLLFAEQQKNQHIKEITAPKKHWWSIFRQK